MYEMWIGIEYGCILILLVLAWIAGKKASALLYSGSMERLQRKARKQLFWAGYLLVVTAGPLVAVYGLMQSYSRLFWEYPLFLHAPFVVVPALMVLFVSVPKLLRLCRVIRGLTGTIQDSQVRDIVSRPGLIVPFQSTALGAATALYFAFVPPATWLEIAIPTAVFLLVSALLWMAHSRRSRNISKSEAAIVSRRWLRALKDVSLLAIAASVATLLIYSGMQSSLLPGKLDMMAGKMDFGGGAALAHDHGQSQGRSTSTAAVSVTKLTGPATGTPDRQFILTAEHGSVQLDSGKSVEDAWTYNGQLPGPELRMKEGELVEVTLLNRDIEQGVTIHWHGLDVPNAEDGVAGATQDAVMPGEKHVYRFVAEQVGTFWYHSHQNSKEAVSKGLFGPLIVEPRTPLTDGLNKDITVITHTWHGAGTAIGASDGMEKMKIAPGTKVRLRLINTDDWIIQKYILTGTSFKVAAIDGTDLHEPGFLDNTRIELPTGGRTDLTFEMPDMPVLLSVGDGKKLGILMSPDGGGEIPKVPSTTKFDPLHYGTRAVTPFDANSTFDRQFDMVLDNKLGFFNGTFDQLYTMNGQVFPNTPMFMVREGDLVKVTITNRGMVDHPMHLHGHHVLVLSRNGEPSTGSPWWSDTLGVLPGETYEIAFRADNPGIWMDHCHNLQHAAAGMTMHLSYEGVTTPFAVGSDTHNHPE